MGIKAVHIASSNSSTTSDESEIYYSSHIASRSTCNALQLEEPEAGETDRFNHKLTLFNIEKYSQLYLEIPEIEFYIITIISGIY